MVDIDLEHLSGLERSAEVIRYMSGKFEYWISPGGALREWLRFNLRVAFSLAVPVVLVAPLVTLALGQVQSWVDLLARTTSNLILFPLSVLLVIGLVSGLFYIGHSIMLMRMRAHRRDPYGY